MDSCYAMRKPPRWIVWPRKSSNMTIWWVSPPSRSKVACESRIKHVFKHKKYNHIFFCLNISSETLRALPKPIAVKREIRARLSTLLKNKSKQTPSSPFERMQFAFGMWLNRTERSTTNTLIGIELWYGRLKRIEGHFGSAIGTYFRFLRSMFVLNGLLALICVGWER